MKLVRGGLAALSASVALAVPAAAAPPNPSATTGAATYVTQSTALLQGVVHTQGQLTYWQFEYGRTTQYGTTTMHRTITAGHGDVPVSIRVRGLNRNSRYHYQLVAQWGQGSESYPINLSFGGDRTFRTRGHGDFGLGPRAYTVHNRIVPVSLYCAGGKGCRGRLRLSIVKSGHSTVVASRSIRLGKNKTHSFPTALNSAAMSRLSKSGSQLTVHLTLVPHSGLGRLTATLHLTRA